MPLPARSKIVDLPSRKQITRQRILAAARTVFGQHGYHDTAVSDVIGAVGMAQGSFYNYFASKKELFATILGDFCNDLCHRVETIDLQRVVDKNSYNQVGMELALSIAELFLRDRDLTRLFYWQSPGIDDDFDDLIDQTFNRITAFTRRFMERGHEQNLLRSDLNLDVAAAAMVGMCSHLINRYLRGDLAHVNDAEIVRTLVNLHLGGILQ